MLVSHVTLERIHWHTRCQHLVGESVPESPGIHRNTTLLAIGFQKSLQTPRSNGGLYTSFHSMNLFQRQRIFLTALGYAFAAWAFAENRFFSSVVRIQEDRGHAVCDSGPYRIVRHPGYAGNILPLLGIVLALGSLWTLIPAAVALVIAVIRTALEDRTLLEELPGYQEYARRVRYRLFPGIY